MFDERSPTEISSGMESENRRRVQREEVARMRSLMRRHAIAVQDGDRAAVARLEAEIRELAGVEFSPADRAGFQTPYERKVRKRGN